MPKPNKLQEKTAKETMDEAFAIATNAFAKDMPLIMHGSGGDEDNHGAQKLVAALTVQYCQQLVEAAIDAWDMLLPDTEPLPPPPPFPKSCTPQEHSTTIVNRKRTTEEFWDTPLPKPKIRGQNQPKSDQPGRWDAIVGVDLWEHTRPREAYVRGISAQQFIFPICHDTYVYGRVRELQAAMVNVTEPLLRDTTVLDIVRAEGEWQREQLAEKKRRRLRKTSKSKQKAEDSDDADKKNGGNGSDAEEEEDPNEEDVTESIDQGARWPGLDALLPAHR